MKNIIIAIAVVSALGIGGYYYKSHLAQQKAAHSHGGGHPHSH